MYRSSGPGIGGPDAAQPRVTQSVSTLSRPIVPSEAAGNTMIPHEVQQKSQLPLTSRMEASSAGAAMLAKKAVLETREVSNAGVSSIVTGVLSASGGFVSGAGTMGLLWLKWRSKRDKSQPDIELATLQSTQSNVVERLANLEKQLNARADLHRAVERSLDQRDKAQRAYEKSLDRRSRVNDEREARFVASERQAREPIQGELSDWERNSRALYLERREDELNKRSDDLTNTKGALERAWKSHEQEKETHKASLAKQLEKHQSQVYRLKYSRVMQEMKLREQWKIYEKSVKALNQQWKVHEENMKPYNDLISLQRQHQSAEAERTRIFEEKLQTLHSRETDIEFEQSAIKAMWRDVKDAREDLDGRQKGLTDWHTRIQRDVDQAQDKLALQKEDLTQRINELQGIERDMSKMSGSLKEQQQVILEKAAGLDRSGLELSQRVAKVKERERKCRSLEQKMQSVIEHLERSSQ